MRVLCISPNWLLPQADPEEITLGLMRPVGQHSLCSHTHPHRTDTKPCARTLPLSPPLKASSVSVKVYGRTGVASVCTKLTHTRSHTRTVSRQSSLRGSRLLIPPFSPSASLSLPSPSPAAPLCSQSLCSVLPVHLEQMKHCMKTSLHEKGCKWIIAL